MIKAANHKVVTPVIQSRSLSRGNVKQIMECCFSEHELPPMEEEELLSWEALMKDRYLLSTQQELSQSVEGRILDTAQK